MFPASDFLVKKEAATSKNVAVKTFQFDFTVGEFVQKDGGVSAVQELEGLKVWVEKVLRTEKNKFPIYDANYGVSLLELMNSGYPQGFLEAEIKREITESLLRNEEIKSVESFSFSREKRRLVCCFTVRTSYGIAFESAVNL